MGLRSPFLERVGILNAAWNAKDSIQHQFGEQHAFSVLYYLGFWFDFEMVL